MRFVGSPQMWAEIVCLQVSRLEDAVEHLHDAAMDQQLPALFEERGKPKESATIVDEAHAILSDRVLATAAADKYFLLLAAAQLVKCVGHLPDDRLPEPQENLLTVLRNFEEHWEDTGGNGGTALRELVPNIQPGRFWYNKHDIWLEGISVTGLRRWAADVRARLDNSEHSSP